MASASGNQYSAAKVSRVPRITAASTKDTASRTGNSKVVDVNKDAQPKLNTRPTPGSGQFFGTASSTSRAVGKGAWNAGAGTKNVIDRAEAPFRLNINPEKQTGV